MPLIIHKLFIRSVYDVYYQYGILGTRTISHQADTFFPFPQWYSANGIECLQFLQEEVKGFFMFDTFCTNQWINDLPPRVVINGSSSIRQQESIDIEERRSIHPS